MTFRKTSHSVLSEDPWAYLAMSSDHAFRTKLEESSWLSLHTVLPLLHNGFTLAGCCRTQGVALGKTLDLSSPSVTSIAPPSRMRTSQQKLHSQLRQSSLCPGPEACDIFCNGILSSSHGRQPRAMAIARIVLGTSGASLTTLCLALRSSFNNHVLGTALFPHAGNLCSNSCSKML